MSTCIYAKTLNGSCFRKEANEYIEGSLLGDIDIHRRYNKEQISDLNFLVAHSLFKNKEEENAAKEKNKDISEKI